MELDEAENALVAYFRDQVRREYPDATVVPSDDHHRMKAKPIIDVLRPYLAHASKDEAQGVDEVELCAMINEIIDLMRTSGLAGKQAARIMGLILPYLRTPQQPQDTHASKQDSWKCNACGSAEWDVTDIDCRNCRASKQEAVDGQIDMASLPFKAAWEVWVYCTDVAKLDRDAALRTAIENYLIQQQLLHPAAKEIASAWQPIETAPKNGEWILVRQADVLEPSATVCSYDSDWGEEGWWMCCDGKNPEIPLRGPEPSEWMPIPSGTAAKEIDAPQVSGATQTTKGVNMNDEQIKHMAHRFLGWKLPKDFHPDGGISFKPTYNDHLAEPGRNEPYGTNLFHAGQAEAMVRYMVEGLQEVPRVSGEVVARLTKEFEYILVTNAKHLLSQEDQAERIAAAPALVAAAIAALQEQSR